jgi:hypothetical protein
MWQCLDCVTVDIRTGQVQCDIKQMTNERTSVSRDKGYGAISLNKSSLSATLDTRGRSRFELVAWFAGNLLKADSVPASNLKVMSHRSFLHSD